MMKKRIGFIKVLRYISLSCVITFGIIAILGSGTGEDDEDDTNNVTPGLYKVYASDGSVSYEDSTNDLGYYPEDYADEAGFVYIGSATGTQTFELPTDTHNILIHSPYGTNTKIDAIEFQDQQGNAVGYIGYDAQGNEVGTWINSGNCGCSSAERKRREGAPDGQYALLGTSCDPQSSNYEIQRGYILTALTGSITDTGAFSKVVIHIVE